MTPATALGATYVAAYAALQGVDEATYVGSLGLALTPEQAGKAIIDLVAAPGLDKEAYLLTGAGLSPLA